MSVGPTPLHRRPHHRYPPLVAVLLVLAGAGAAVLLLYQYDVFKRSSSSTAVQGSGVAASQTRDVGSFTSVELAGSNNVTVRVGGKQSVVVHADDNLTRRVTTRVQNGRLVLGTTPGSFEARSPMYVDIVVPSLEAMVLSGSGVLVATGVSAPSLTVTLDGSGVLRASGHANRLDVGLTGSGDAQLDQLTAADVHAVVSGSGRILVTATKRLDASVPGSGVVIYGGNPAQVTTSITGSGAVARG